MIRILFLGEHGGKMRFEKNKESFNDELIEDTKEQFKDDETITKKLKTLKEMSLPCKGSPLNYESFVSKRELRQEVIKWIKAFNLKNKKAIINLDGIEWYNGDNEINEVVYWIKHFFNITEEDITGKIKSDEHLPSGRCL